MNLRNTLSSKRNGATESYIQHYFIQLKSKSIYRMCYSEIHMSDKITKKDKRLIKMPSVEGPLCRGRPGDGPDMALTRGKV